MMVATRRLVDERRSVRAFLNALPRSVKRLLMISFDVVALPAALLTAVLLRFGDTRFTASELTLMLVLAPVIAVPIFITLDLYRAVIRYLELRMAMTVVAAVTVAVSLLLLVLAMVGLRSFTAADALVYWTVALVYVGGTRLIAREYLGRASARGAREPIIIYGAGDAGADLAVSLRNKGLLVPVAFVDDHKDIPGSFLYGIKVYPPDQLPSLVRELGVRQVLLAMPSATKQQRRRVFKAIEPLGIKTRTIPRLPDLIEGRARISDIQDVSIEDVVGRDPVPPVPGMLSKCIAGKVVLVTGAGGSIGSELSRQILSHGPRKLILLDLSEFALYSITEELLACARTSGYSAEIVSVIGSVTRTGLLNAMLGQHGVDTIYHAAAYKHVPLVEANAVEGIRNNVIGTWRLAKAALDHGVGTFVSVSTDKAVRPANIMGASKRLAELVVQGIGATNATRFCMVRFGNVLDSSGSVVPLFRKQIQAGGPVTVTHPEITRYFMTIPEAAQLVLQAGAMAKGGDVFVLDMGEPVKIRDLARSMIRLSGLTVRDTDNPHGDIEIQYTGLRPGEKLYEELLIGNNATGTEHPHIMREMEQVNPWLELKPILVALEKACNELDTDLAVSILSSIVPVTGRETHDGKKTSATFVVRSKALHLVSGSEKVPAVMKTPE
jgi:FlaA1/EpsC-like NDP-sugar epimerase